MDIKDQTYLENIKTLSQKDIPKIWDLAGKYGIFYIYELNFFVMYNIFNNKLIVKDIRKLSDQKLYLKVTRLLFKTLNTLIQLDLKHLSKLTPNQIILLLNATGLVTLDLLGNNFHMSVFVYASQKVYTLTYKILFDNAKSKIIKKISMINNELIECLMSSLIESDYLFPVHTFYQKLTPKLFLTAKKYYYVSNFYPVKKINNPDQVYPAWRKSLNFYDGKPYYYNCCPRVYEPKSGFELILIPSKVSFYRGIGEIKPRINYKVRYLSNHTFLTSYNRAKHYAFGINQKLLPIRH